MKIVHLVAGIEEANGAAVIACGIARTQAKIGHDVTVVTLSGGGPECALNGVKVVRCRKSFPGFIFFSWEMMRQLKNIIQNVDLVHTHCQWTFPVWWGAWCAVLLGKRLVMTPEGSFDPIRLAHSAWKKKLAAPLDRWCLRHADVVQATVPMESEWVRSFEPRVKRVVVVPPGVEVAGEDRLTQRRGDAEKRDGDFESRVRRLLYLGRRHPLKGLDILEDALALLSRSNSIEQSNNRTIVLRQESAIFGEEKARALAECDALVLPTRSENFGLVVAEALAAGKPVIVTDGAPWEGVREKKCGWFVEGFKDGNFDRERAVANLKRALEEFAATPRDELEEMGARGRAWMAQDFGWDKTVERLMKEVE